MFRFSSLTYLSRRGSGQCPPWRDADFFQQFCGPTLLYYVNNAKFSQLIISKIMTNCCH